MTAKALLVLATALCALSAVSASPYIRLVQQGPKLGLELQNHGLESLKQNKNINTTAILEKIEEILGAIEDKINEVSTEVESAVEAVLAGIENSALEVADRWNASVNEWAEKAAEAGVNVQDCIDSQKSINDVAAELANDARQCVNSSAQEVSDALDAVKAVGPETRALLQEVSDQVKVCNSKPNIVESSLCLVSSLPALQIKAAGLLTKAVWRAGVAATKATAIVPLASLCTSKATAGRAAEATVIVKETVSCIKGKLGPSSSRVQLK